MEIRIEQNNKSFIKEYHSYLTKYEIEMQLFVRNLFTNELLDAQIRGGVYENNDLKIIFLNALPHNFQIFSLQNDNYEAFDYLAKYIVENKIPIKGCQGSLKDCQQFITAYHEWTGKLIKYQLSMDIMKLTKVNETNTLGTLRVATINDKNIIRKGFYNFVLETLSETLDEVTLEMRIDNFCKSNNFYLHVNSDNKVTSFAHCNKVLPHGICIGAVYTFPIYRGNGYAKSMLYLLCKEFLNNNEYITLFVDKGNPISNKLYKDLGFNILTDNYDCRLD